ncbi:MAG TPA: hypothetical protein ENN13_04325 [Candidatus Altiarchaeales archaeon]|nr:hypothetical protein [Candidatus Altiarchaeales archaeon]
MPGDDIEDDFLDDTFGGDFKEPKPGKSGGKVEVRPKAAPPPSGVDWEVPADDGRPPKAGFPVKSLGVIAGVVVLGLILLLILPSLFTGGGGEPSATTTMTSPTVVETTVTIASTTLGTVTTLPVDAAYWDVFWGYFKALNERDIETANRLGYNVIDLERCLEFQGSEECYYAIDIMYQISTEVVEDNFVNVWEDERQAILSTELLNESVGGHTIRSKEFIYFVKDGSGGVRFLGIDRKYWFYEEDLASAILDGDMDGLTDREENCELMLDCVRTNPKRRDTDGDGWWDGVEVKANTNPLNNSDYPFTKGFSATTTTLKGFVECSADADCGEPPKDLYYCGDFMRPTIQKYTWLCLNRGMIDSRCVQIPSENIPLKTCASSEYCFRGECIPFHCNNGVRDFGRGEVKIDCGGPCPPCNISSVLCSSWTDCGEEYRIGTYYCNIHDISQDWGTYICENPGALNSKCVDSVRTEVVKQCVGIKEACTPGRSYCAETASCFDCMQNQGEERIDCGGRHCKACAVWPEKFDVLTLDISRSYDYKNYRIELDRIVFGHGTEFGFAGGGCNMGALLHIRNPDGITFKQVEVDIYKNAEVSGYPNLQVGFINTTSRTATIWLTTSR